jgi:hypothetical protein
VSDPQQPLADLNVDKDNLYREEVFTDLKVASIRRLTPIKTDGSEDADRPVRFIAETTLMSARGPLPVQANIEATNLDAAIEKFPAAVNEAVEQMIEQAKEMQRQEQSRIVVANQMPPDSKIISG